MTNILIQHSADPAISLVSVILGDNRAINESYLELNLNILRANLVQTEQRVVAGAGPLSFHLKSLVAEREGLRATIRLLPQTEVTSLHRQNYSELTKKKFLSPDIPVASQSSGHSLSTASHQHLFTFHSLGISVFASARL